MDNYNLHGCLLMSININKYNLRGMSIDDYGLYGSFLNV